MTVDENFLRREIDCLGGRGNSLQAEAVGEEKCLDTGVLESPGEQQGSGRAVGFGCGRIAFGNVETGDQTDVCSVLSKVAGGGRQMPRAKWPEFRFAADQPTASGVASNQEVKLIDEGLWHGLNSLRRHSGHRFRVHAR